MSYSVIEEKDKVSGSAINIDLRAEVFADTTADIPAPRENWAVGSIAYVIATGVFYMLNSSGNWVNQNDFSVLEIAEENQENQE